PRPSPFPDTPLFRSAARTALRLGTAGDRAGFAAARRRAARCTAADGDRQGLATTHGADLDPRARGAVAVAGSSARRRALSVPLPDRKSTRLNSSHVK